MPGVVLRHRSSRSLAAIDEMVWDFSGSRKIQISVFVAHLDHDYMLDGRDDKGWGAVRKCPVLKVSGVSSGNRRRAIQRENPEFPEKQLRRQQRNGAKNNFNFKSESKYPTSRLPEQAGRKISSKISLFSILGLFPVLPVIPVKIVREPERAREKRPVAFPKFSGI